MPFPPSIATRAYSSALGAHLPGDPVARRATEEIGRYEDPVARRAREEFARAVGREEAAKAARAEPARALSPGGRRPAG